MGQPFVMLFAAFVGALVLIWGIYQISKLNEFSEEVQLIDTMNNFQRVVEQYYHFNKGSSREYTINLPSRFKKICFYHRTPPDELGYNNIVDMDIDENFIKARKGENVFIFPIEKGSVFNVENLRPEGATNPVCFKSREEFVITSMDSYVAVSKIP